jgi:hypothetical protein
MIPRLAAAFNRSTLLVANQNPNGIAPGQYYQNPVTNVSWMMIFVLGWDGMLMVCSLTALLSLGTRGERGWAWLCFPIRRCDSGWWCPSRRRDEQSEPGVAHCYCRWGRCLFGLSKLHCDGEKGVHRDLAGFGYRLRPSCFSFCFWGGGLLYSTDFLIHCIYAPNEHSAHKAQHHHTDHLRIPRCIDTLPCCPSTRTFSALPANLLFRHTSVIQMNHRGSSSPWNVCAT